jgi:hypothetical protein
LILEEEDEDVMALDLIVAVSSGGGAYVRVTAVTVSQWGFSSLSTSWEIRPA